MSKVYFSQHLTAYKCWLELENALQELQIDYVFLLNTRDIWMRDFMPIVSPEGHYISYTYAPDYLRSQPQFITNWRNAILLPSYVPHVNANLILD